MISLPNINEECFIYVCGVRLYVQHQHQLQLMILQSGSKLALSTQLQLKLKLNPKYDLINIEQTPCFDLGSSLVTAVAHQRD